MKSINIVFFISNLDSGGIENYLLRYLKYQSHSFKEIYIYCKSGNGGELESEYLSIPNVHIVKNKIGYLNLKPLFKLIVFFKKNKIEAVCDFTGNFSGLVLMTAYVSCINKRIALYRSSSDRFKKNIMRAIYNKFLNRLVLKFATDILANSNAGLKYFFSNGFENDVRFEVIQNGVDSKDYISETNTLRDMFDIPKSAFVVGHTGRFNEAKNHSTIIEVANILVKKYPDIYFILCGKGVCCNLQQNLKKMGISDKVLVFENRRDIPEFLNTMNCYFFPSLTEGQPNALIEAMICGIPYVASDIDPIKETVFGSDNLFPPNNIEAYVKAITYIHSNYAGRDRELQTKAIAKYDHKNAFSRFTSRIYQSL
ncbi:glycosyl transferase [Psychrobacter sp. Sarcosine-02u-2]|uniref:glycosyltransferase n=1 Tax=Psychrobacter sp. Sarcosine-02u-2 TaxID=2058324 RepID=UPI000C7A1CD0|nr:glycosyltransferase [Psychrobacter sp. Sarcosine-02u-2]PKG88822.1 glycosyl transferase [Psychrobacter sp. Sarcosine-02u-2]